MKNLGYSRLVKISDELDLWDAAGDIKRCTPFHIKAKGEANKISEGPTQLYRYNFSRNPKLCKFFHCYRLIEVSIWYGYCLEIWSCSCSWWFVEFWFRVDCCHFLPKIAHNFWWVEIQQTLIMGIRNNCNKGKQSFLCTSLIYRRRI